MECHDLWFPGLATALAKNFERSSRNLDEYGTARWLSSNNSGRRSEVASVTIWRRSCMVEALANTDQRLFPGLTFQSPTSDDLLELKSAAELLNELPTLARSVSWLVRSIHVLASEPEYDVSHSDPDLPFSIFVSVPTAEPFAKLRLLESIVHEAMHLQLTLMEQVIPMTNGDFFAYSPWQNRPRPAQGLLHGLYVFTVIFQVMKYFSTQCPTMSHAARKRLKSIHTEISALDDFDQGLSPLGQTLSRRARLLIAGI